MEDPRWVLIGAAGHAWANAPGRMTVRCDAFDVSGDGLGIETRNEQRCLRGCDYSDEMGRKPASMEL